MAEDYRIHINFISIVGDIPDFCVYRRLRASPQEEHPEGQNVRAYALPRNKNDVEKWPSYWISLQPESGFERFLAKPTFNHNLTCWILLAAIGSRCKSELAPNEFWIPERGFVREVQFNLRHHAEGEEQLIIQPYYLRAKKKFGVLADFHFRLKEGVKFSRRIQQLCLSLDGNYKRNLDFYGDRLSKITTYLKEKWSILSPIDLPGAEVTVELNDKFESVLADRLQSRMYVFSSNRESRSQFIGLKDFGPLKSLAATPKLLFVFREKDRQAGRSLALALRGSRQRERYSFPGFESLFKIPLEIDSNPVIVPDFSVVSMETALERIRKETNLTLPVLILPDGDDDGYLNHKAIFTHAGIPSQVCTLGVIQDENTLKWSVANIALQIFCKAGGWPWKVRATAGDCLIIGISQSHKIRKQVAGTSVEKYFAFSILTDSSGLFKKIQVLGQAEDEATYLEQLRTNLRAALLSEAQHFSRVVIHTSFKLKHREIDEIKKVVQSLASNGETKKCRFAVIKVNHKSRFFGTNQSVNSLIPYEGSRVKLGQGE
jgi:hypothetical protein